MELEEDAGGAGGFGGRSKTKQIERPAPVKRGSRSIDFITSTGRGHTKSTVYMDVKDQVLGQVLDIVGHGDGMSSGSF